MKTYHDMISSLLQNNQSDIDAYFGCYQESIEKSIKIVTHKVSQDDLFAMAKQYWWTLTAPGFVEHSDTYYITRDTYDMGLGKHWLHTSWFFYMQEVAASLPANILPIKTWDIVLDMCAAPWGKSVQLWDGLFNQTDKESLPQATGFVVSNEMSGSRIISLQSNLNRTGIYNGCVTNMSWSVFGSILPNFFDAVLVDAPCSWEGTGFKSDAGTKRWREDLVHKIARTQKELLTSAIKTCKAWWYIVYATCTINPWENEWVVSYILNKYSDYLTLENVAINNKTSGVTHRQDETLLSEEDAQKVARFWPHIQHTGWFFIALFKKTKETLEVSDKPQKTTESQLLLSDDLQEKITEILFNDYNIELPKDQYFFVSTQKQVYVTTKDYLLLHNKIHIEKAGVPIFKWNNNKELRPLHGLWNILGHLATKNVIQLDDTSLQRYSDGYDLTTDILPTTSHAYVIVQYKQRWISVGKIVWDTLKNKYMK